MKKETLAILGVAVTPVDIEDCSHIHLNIDFSIAVIDKCGCLQVTLVLPALVAKYTSGPRPLDPFMAAVPYRLFAMLSYAAGE